MRALGLVLAGLLVACQGTISARERGKQLLGDPGLSDSPANVFACEDCHEIEVGGAGSRVLPGYSLVDSAFRDGYWGGYERTLIEAMSYCRITFMRGVAFEEEADDARAILEYLLSVSTTDPAPQLPLTVTLDIVEVERGDPARGAEVYERACAHCHGDAGARPPEAFREDVTAIPDDEAGWADLYDEDFPDTPFGLIVTEKVRHGRFFLVGGVMPLFSQEALSDADLGALLAHMEI